MIAFTLIFALLAGYVAQRAHTLLFGDQSPGERVADVLLIALYAWLAWSVWPVTNWSLS